MNQYSNTQVAVKGDNGTATSGEVSLAARETPGQAYDENGKAKIKGGSQEQKLLVKIYEAAQMLSISTASMRRLIARGEIAVNRKLRHVLIPRTELERFAAGRTK